MGLAAEATARLTGFVSLAAGAMVLLTQAVIVPRLGWPPRRLIRTGIPVAIVGFGMLVPDLGFGAVLVGMALAGLGLGIAMPGYMAGPTLLVEHGEQGGVAGLISSTNALSFVAGPLVGTALYDLRPVAPFLVSVGVLALLAVFVVVNPVIRRGDRPVEGAPPAV
ncbi:MAG: MFS transporter [Streptosporangiales bacterium]|nr:MFS transporter [Streptosporangiales bacterium]